MAETDFFSIQVLRYAYSEPNGLSGRGRQLLGPQEIDVTCKSCREQWKELSAGCLQGALGRVEIECPKCGEEEMVAGHLLRPHS